MTDEEILSKYYLSIEMNDRTGLFLELTKIFAASDVGFDKIIQEPIEGGMAKVVIITHLMNRKQEKEILAKLKKADDMNLLIHLKVMEG